MNNKKNQLSQSNNSNNSKNFPYKKFQAKELTDEELTDEKASDISQPEDGKRAGLIIGIIIGMIVLVVGGVGITLVARIWDPLWNPFRPEPEKVIENMFNNMKEVKRIHSKTKADIITTGQDEGYVISLLIESDLDASDYKNIKTNGSFDFAITGKGEMISLAGENRTIDKTSYLKMDIINLGDMEIMLMMFGIDLDKTKGEWIKFDEKALESLSQDTQDTEMSEEEQIAIIGKAKEIFTKHKIYYVKEELTDEKIGDKKVYHYLLGLDKEEFKKAISEIFRYMIETEAFKESIEDFGPGESFASAALIGAWEGVMDEFLGKIGEITFDFWIGKKDELLYRAGLEKEIDMSGLIEREDGSIIVKLNLDFSNFDEPITIEAPKNYLELKDIFGGAGLFNQFPQSGLKDGLEIPSKLEIEYQSYNKPIIKIDKTSLFQASLK